MAEPGGRPQGRAERSRLVPACRAASADQRSHHRGASAGRGARGGAALGRPDRAGFRRAARVHAGRDRSAGAAGPPARHGGRVAAVGLRGQERQALRPAQAGLPVPGARGSSSGPGSRSASPTWSGPSPPRPTRSGAWVSRRPLPSTSAPSSTSWNGSRITAHCACRTARRRTGRTTASGETPCTTSTTISARRCSGLPGRSSSCLARPACWTWPTSP
jgi:hypothetical protein